VLSKDFGVFQRKKALQFLGIVVKYPCVLFHFVMEGLPMNQADKTMEKIVALAKG
jgi:hypothetical protein